MTALQRFARQRPITLFLVLVFGIGYPLMFVPYLASKGVIPGGSLPGRVGLDVERASSLLLVWLALLPAALITTGLEGGRAAVGVLLRRATRFRIGLAWWLIVLFAVPVATIAIAVAMGDGFRPPTAATLGAELAGILVGFVLANFGEEIAWAGFFQTRLERRHTLYVAAALTAIPFAAIHLPLQVINGNSSAAALAIAFLALTVLGLVFRSMLGLALRGAANSVFAVALMHTMFNRSNNTDGVAARLLDGSHRQVAALIATAVVTVALGYFLRHRATRAERARLDALDGDGTEVSGV